MVRLFFIGVILLLIAPLINAKEKITLTFVAGEWPKYANTDGSGTYWDIVRSVYGAEYQLELISTPWARAKNLMKANKADAIMAIISLEREQLIIPEQHLDTEYAIVALFERSKRNIRSAQDLAGLTIAGRSQYGFEYFMPKNINYYGVASISDANKLIFNNRVDVVLASTYNRQKADPTATLDYVEVIPEQQLYIGFHDTELGRKLSAMFDEKIPELLKNNQLMPYFPSEEEYEHAKLKRVMKLTK